MSVIVPLPWTKPPLSQNDRGKNPHVKAAKVAEALAVARGAIRAAKLPPIDAAAVTLHYRVPDRRRRDADNICVVLKVCQDALVQEHVLRDDSFAFVPRSGHEIHPPGDEGAAMWLEIEAI